MKIIGKTDTEFIVQISTAELDYIIGEVKSNILIGRRNSRCPYRIGDELEISELWRQMNTLYNNKDELTKIADRINEYASLLRAKEPLVWKNIEISKENL